MCWGGWPNRTNAQYSVALHAVIELHRRGEILHLTPQVLIEFRSIATRSIAQNGLGLSADDTEALAGKLRGTGTCSTAYPHLRLPSRDILGPELWRFLLAYIKSGPSG